MPKDTFEFPDDMDAYFTSAELMEFQAANTNTSASEDEAPEQIDAVEPINVPSPDDVPEFLDNVVQFDAVKHDDTPEYPDNVVAFDAVVHEDPSGPADSFEPFEQVEQIGQIDAPPHEDTQAPAAEAVPREPEVQVAKSAWKLKAAMWIGGHVARSAGTTFVVTVLIIVFLFARELPNEQALVNYRPALTTEVIGADGAVLDEFASVRRSYVAIEDIPEVMQHAIISAEDKNFLTHAGFDARAISIAFYEAVVSGGERRRGASTITQQLLKNLSLQREPVVDRKLREIVLANRLEHLLGKQVILEIYLNEIFFGQNAYGVAAAAQVYFNKPLSALAPHEAATLSAFAQGPARLHPVRNHTRLLTRRNYVLREMLQNGYLSQARFDEQVKYPLETVQSGDLASYAPGQPARTYLTDGIRRELSQTLGADVFDADGLSVQVSFDPHLQATAERTLRRALERFDRGRHIWRPTGFAIDPSLLDVDSAWRDALAGVAIARDIATETPWLPAVVLSLSRTSARIGIEGVADDHDGHWLQFRHTNWQRRQEVGGPRGRWASRMSHLLREGEVVHVRSVLDNRGRHVRWSLRQVPELQGGFMAMDVHSGRVVAMQGGFSYEHSPFNRATQALRQPGSTFKPVVYAAALNEGYEPSTRVLDGRITIQTETGPWRPQNADHRTIGRAPMRKGLEQSRNLMTVRLAQDVGLPRIGALAEELGLYEQFEPNFANVLGTQETTLARLLGAYGTIANGGRRVRPTLVHQAFDRDDRILQGIGSNDIQAIAGAQVLDPAVALDLTTMLRSVVDRGTARRAVSLDVPVAGKTGTTDDAKDVWFVGFTSTLAAGCYIGYDTPRPIGSRASGASFCGPVFQEFMREAIKSYGGEAFVQATPRTIIGAGRASAEAISNRSRGRVAGGADLRD